MPLPLFIRLVSGERGGTKELLEGQIELDGDMAIAQRLRDMFGQPSLY